jgi:hypothetical protein
VNALASGQYLRLVLRAPFMKLGILRRVSALNTQRKVSVAERNVRDGRSTEALSQDNGGRNRVDEPHVDTIRSNDDYPSSSSIPPTITATAATGVRGAVGRLSARVKEGAIAQRIRSVRSPRTQFSAPSDAVPSSTPTPPNRDVATPTATTSPSQSQSQSSLSFLEEDDDTDLPPPASSVFPMGGVATGGRTPSGAAISNDNVPNDGNRARLRSIHSFLSAVSGIIDIFWPSSSSTLPTASPPSTSASAASSSTSLPRSSL